MLASLSLSQLLVSSLSILKSIFVLLSFVEVSILKSNEVNSESAV
jgi:hypothetical protein